MKNDYYDIACNDIIYLQNSLNLPLYNQIAVNAQQVVEGLLKSAAERTCIGIEKLMLSHNLRALYDEIHKVEPSFKLDRGQLSMLKDYYFDAKYPGDNFVIVSQDDCDAALTVMYDTVNEVNRLRETLGLPIKKFERKFTEKSRLEDLTQFN